MVARKKIANQSWRFMRKYDLLLTPTIAVAPFKQGIQGVWSPDGRSVLIAAGVPEHASALVVVPSNPAGGEPRVVLAVRNAATDIAPAGFAGWVWSSDGRTIYFLGRDPHLIT